MSVCEGILY
ncbi:hypothetical protein LINPERHAP1_LOCUS35711 [Linum perenne]